MVAGQGTVADSDQAVIERRWTEALAALWQKQSRVSRSADQRKATYSWWTGPLAAIGFLGVVLSTISPNLVSCLAAPGALDRSMWQVVATLIGPLLVATCAVLARELLGPKGEHAWIKARGIAEELKAEGYIFATGAPPYLERTAAPTQLVEKIRLLTSDIESLGILPAAAPDVAQRHPNRSLDVDSYIKIRVNGQITYYRSKAENYHSRLRFWRNIAVGLAVSAAALGTAAGIAKTASINVWVAVVSTAMATVTTYVYANRFEFLAASYFATSERLDDLITAWNVGNDHSAGAQSRFILDCESVLAAQNRSWQDELSKRVSERLKKIEPPIKDR